MLAPCHWKFPVGIAWGGLFIAVLKNNLTFSLQTSQPMLQLHHIRHPPKKSMTQQEHLNRIRARCVELLKIAGKRSQEYSAPAILQRPDWEPLTPGGTLKAGGWSAHLACSDIRFIASCAGAAEAGWKATIAAIDHIESGWMGHDSGIDVLTSKLITSWPAELL